MPREQFIDIQNMNWHPVKLEGNAIPDFLNEIPEDVLHSVYASGTPIPGIPYSDSVILSGSLIGGIDVYRNAPEDPVELNKDWYGVITISDSDSMLLIRGPIADSDHWLDSIPDRLEGAIVVSVPPNKSE